MAATITNYLIKGGTIKYDGSATPQFKDKLNIIGAHFSTLERFKATPVEEMNSFTTEEGYRAFNPLSVKESEAIRALQNEVRLDLSIEENFIVLLTKDFIRKQITMLENMTIDKFNANPILCYALKLNNSRDFITYNAYQAISRSIVTSMGFLVQDLLLFSNENIFEGKNYYEGKNTKWDLVIDKLDEVKSFLEIKSGFNDMDAAQIKHYDEEINLVEQSGNKAFIGITYGKKDTRTVTSSLLETYVQDWRRKTLVGKELWDYVSENEGYHETLITTINNTANAMLNNDSIVRKINDKIDDLLLEFDTTYSNMDDYYNTLW